MSWRLRVDDKKSGGTGSLVVVVVGTRLVLVSIEDKWGLFFLWIKFRYKCFTETPYV